MAEIVLTPYETIGAQNRYLINQTNGNLIDLYSVTLDNTSVFRVDIIANNAPFTAQLLFKNVSADTEWTVRNTITDNTINLKTLLYSDIAFKFSQLPSTDYSIIITVFKMI